MAIKVITPQVVNGSCTTDGVEPVTVFEGRVLKVEKVTETRNWSDTLDYTDNRSTECTYALVWLGTHGVRPYAWGGRTTTRVEHRHAPADDLEYWEQFAWVDCTNLFTWRGSPHLEPTVDAEMGTGDPLMWVNYLAWQGHLKGLAEKAARDAEAERLKRAEEAKVEAAKKAARQAKSDAEKALVEAKMVHTPEKGTECTVDGFTGKVFWKGVKLYRNKWRGTVGLKDAKGAVAWIDVGHWVK